MLVLLIIAINPPNNPTRELPFIHSFGDLYLMYLFRYLLNVTMFQASIRHWRYVREQKQSPISALMAHTIILILHFRMLEHRQVKCLF